MRTSVIGGKVGQPMADWEEQRQHEENTKADQLLTQELRRMEAQQANKRPPNETPMEWLGGTFGNLIIRVIKPIRARAAPYLKTGYCTWKSLAIIFSLTPRSWRRVRGRCGP